MATVKPSIDAPGACDAIRAVAASFVRFESAPISANPLGWPGYDEQLKRARVASGETEAVLSGYARVGGIPVVMVAFDFRFVGGSMGAATGDRIIEGVRQARHARVPLVSLIASGGARIQEGMHALTQMPRIAAELAANRSAGVPHVAVLRHPTTGGVWASLASSADIVLATQGAAISFGGSRVRGVDPGGDTRAFTSTGQYRAGSIDRELPAEEIPPVLEQLVRLLSPRKKSRPCAPPVALGNACEEGDAWGTVLAARAASRPRAAEYLDWYFDESFDISGDRSGGVDPGIRCGFGGREDHTIAYMAQSGAQNTAAGFRTARRLLDLAERLDLAVLSLIDTPGAANDAAAEAGGVGPAIAELLIRMADLKVPLTSVLVGEGGSGGALALCGAELWAAPESYFAVITPELAAAILGGNAAQAPEIAPLMGLRPCDLRQGGFIRGTLPRQH